MTKNLELVVTAGTEISETRAQNDLIIARLEQAEHLLAQASTINHAKQIVDIAEAARIYAKRQKLSISTIKRATTIRADAQRLLGEFLKAKSLARGMRGSFKGRDPSGGYKSVPPEEDIPTLEILGLNKRESADAQFVAKVADEHPGAFELIREGTPINRVRYIIKKKEKEREKAILAENPIELPGGVYDVIVIDPPWPMQKIMRDARPNQVAFDYPTMEEEELGGLSLPYADNAHVFAYGI